VKSLRCLASGCALIALLCTSGTAQGATRFGQLTGVVLDPTGTPQLGASIWISSEAVNARGSTQLLTDQNGAFGAQHLRPGQYSVRVTLAGFLPAIQQHVRVGADLTTLVRIELDSVFSSLDQLRRQPAQSTEADDWKWVLRTSSATRPVLQLRDGTIVIAGGASPALPGGGDSPRQARVSVEMTSGYRHPGSSSALPGAPATAISYDQPLGSAGRLLLAGEMSYDPLAGAGTTFASIWLPSGRLDQGSETTIVVRESKFPLTGRQIRSVRAEHSGQVELGDRMVLDYGTAYAVAGIGTINESLRPHARIAARLSPHWDAAFSLETEPGSYGLRTRSPALESALDTLDTLPVLIWRDGRSELESNWHEELAARRDVGAHGSFEAATFHDYSPHLAVFGYDPASNSGSPLIYARDGGVAGSWGSRLTYRQKLSDHFELAAIYAWAGALAPDSDGNLANADQLSNALRIRYRHSVAGRVSGKIPRVRTQFAASYKWLNGTAVSRQDLFGEAAEGLDPNLSLSLRQPLPSFGTGGHWEALADFRNLLAQGYVPLNGQQGQVVLTPVMRSFRGGVSFQF
jgi:hypothetical protein